MKQPLYLLIWYPVALAAGWALFALLAKTLTHSGHTRPNFQGRQIPTSMGVGFPLLAVAFGALAAIIPGLDLDAYIPQIVIISFGFSFLGLLDDLVIIREKGGFRGHFGRIATSGVSTAILKAVFGVGLAFLTAVIYWKQSAGWQMAIVDTLIVALAANAINMLDVRPGRAVKGFLLSFILIIGITFVTVALGSATILPQTLVLLVPFALWTTAYAARDFTCSAMLGDTGSNALGAILGLLIVWELSNVSKWICLAILVAFQLFCEAFSLTTVIERVKLFRFFDRLGIRIPPPSSEG